VSYILDALKKSERQRPPGPVPDLFTVHGPRPPSPRRPARTIVVVALLLAVLALALWVWTGTDRSDEGAARPPIAAAPQPRVDAPAVPVTKRSVAAPTPLAPPATAPVAASNAASNAASDAARKPVGDQAQTPAPPVQKPRVEAASAVVPVAIPAAPPAIAAPPAPSDPAPGAGPAVPLAVPATPGAMPLPPPAGVSVPSTATPMPAPTPSPTPSPMPTPTSKPAPMPTSKTPPGGIPAAPPAASPEPVPAVPTAPVAPASEATPPADGRVLDLAELPAQIRAGLPKLLVSGHVWSEEPSLRLLSVDDRLLREGGEAAPGVSIQEITPAGAILVFKGWHFRVTGGRP
jgi:general secretion pathway protein B